MKFRKTTIQALVAPLIISGGFLALSGNVYANDSEELEKLRALVQELDQKVKIIERKDEIAAEDAAAKKKETPVVNAGPAGFGIKSADGQFEYRLKGLVQFDNRHFISDDENSATNNSDGFTARRIRPTFEGTLFGKYDFRFTPEFGEANNLIAAPSGNTSRVIDAYVDARIEPWFKVRVGKHKPFVGLERLQSGGDIKFIERSYVSNNILPNRALGASVYGDVLENKLNYAVGVFNGSNDGGEDTTAVDTDTNKEYTARLFTTPFKGEDSVLEGLGFGVAVTHSNSHTTNTISPGTLPSYKTPAQQLNFFTYSNAIADGSRDRIAPQAYYYNGPFGILAEYARVSQEVARTAAPLVTEKLKNDAWEIAGSWVLTGEDASFKSVKPKNPFQTGKDGWGAWELVARYQQISVDDDAFSTATQARFADPRTQAKEAKTWGVGLNWYLNQWVRLAVNYEQTKFDGGGSYTTAGTATGPLVNVADRNDEKILFSRLQFQF